MNPIDHKLHDYAFSPSSQRRFRSQKRIDNFNNVRRGYKSPMVDFQEDKLGIFLKKQYHY
jgi:hypothetical protein